MHLLLLFKTAARRARAAARLLLLAVLLTPAAGCDQTTSLLVTLRFDAVYRPTLLSLTVEIGALVHDSGFAPGRPIGPGDSFALVLPDELEGQEARIRLETRGMVPVLRGEGRALVARRRQVPLDVLLTAGEPAGDMAVPLDAGVDLAVPGDLLRSDGPVLDLDGDSGQVDLFRIDAPPPDLALGDAAPIDGTGMDGALTDGPPADLARCNPGACPLGCNAQSNRCNRPIPACLGRAPDEARLGADVTIAADTVVDTATGMATRGGQPVSTGLSFIVDNGAQPNGAPRLAVFGARALTVAAGATLRFVDQTMSSPGNAVLLVVAGDVRIEGAVEVGAVGAGGRPGAGVLAGPGGFAGASTNVAGGGPPGCGGQPGANQANNNSGGGGGGAAASGGDSAKSGGAALGAGGTAAFKANPPLVGGCGGGSGSGPNVARTRGGGGGGALQLSAGGRLTVTATARIGAAGNGGNGGAEVLAGGGGGGGGMIVLEGAEVTVLPGAVLSANGGGGGGGGQGAGAGAGQDGAPGPATLSAAPGGTSTSGPGGPGGFGGSLAGGNSPAPAGTNSGGGGGAAGWIISVAGLPASVPMSARSGAYTALTVARTY